MNYIVFDLEFNQDFKPLEKTDFTNKPKCTFEIMQIGAIKLDDGFNTISTFNRLIKPEIYTKVHPYVEEITGINLSMLSAAKPFKEVYDNLVNFINEDSVMCIWGLVDMKELFNNINYHNLSIAPIPKSYIDIQYYASKHFKYPKGTSIGLHNAVELFNLPIENSFHDALHDAVYTAEILKKIYNKQMLPKIYIPDENRTINMGSREKQALDDDKLIKQFEKMYNRELTKDEIAMIKVAYLMGKTNQFQKNKQ